jgi:hypothetical protein
MKNQTPDFKKIQEYMLEIGGIAGKMQNDLDSKNAQKLFFMINQVTQELQNAKLQHAAASIK